MPARAVPDVRVRACNEAPVRAGGDFVLYWMIAARRPRWNFALDRAVELAAELDRPLLVLEALRCGHRWASDRIHRFVLDGMHDNAAAFARARVAYHPYVEPERGAGSGLVEALAGEACAVVTDEFPCFFLPRMVSAAARRLRVRLEAVDSNGLLPLRAAERVYSRAVDFRRFLQRELPRHLQHVPHRDLRAARRLRPGRVPPWVARRWPSAVEELRSGGCKLGGFPIDHSIPPVPFRGGAAAGEGALRRFLDDGLESYGRTRSGLSPFLHFGHVSVHQALEGLAEREDWNLERASRHAGGQREGWWGMSAAAESFLDELVTWRELGHNFCARRPDYDRFASLPAWALSTLEKHRADPRPRVYSLDEFESGATHDRLWNAAQCQLRTEGRIDGYLRMLWGKKILHWSASPEHAAEFMIELNDKYAIDGRDPNSYSGIFWTLGRYDRPWGPERTVFGTIRYMSSSNTRRKMDVDAYVSRWLGLAPEASHRTTTGRLRNG